MERSVGVLRKGQRKMAALAAPLLIATLLVGVMATPASALVFSNVGAITIPASGTGPSNASPYPSTISVAGTSGTITDVNVTLSGLSHSVAQDVDVLLVGPFGQNVVLMADTCGAAIGPVTLTFSDGSASLGGGPCASGTYSPTNSGGFNGGPPAPAPSGATLSVFNGTTANGTWSLFVYDDAALDVGSIAGGWSLDISGVSTAPTITSFTPTSGPIGTSVVITGTNFTGATAVQFGGVAATVFTVNLATQITATVPTGALTGPITVVTPAGSGASLTNFTVTGPSITSFTPTSGGIGTVVTITGTNFTGATSVKFGGVSATSFTVNSSTQITATVPTGAVTGPISVTTATGTGTSAASFTVIPAPTITSFTPAKAQVGNTVVITGTNFTGATSVKFGALAAAFTFNSSTQLTATVPAGASTATLSVTTAGGTATSASAFVVSHARAVTLNLTAKKAKGTVVATDGFTACAASVLVKVQHLVNGNWKTLTTVTTGSSGAYSAGGVGDDGKFRVVAKKVTVGSGDVCLKDVSNTQKH